MPSNIRHSSHPVPMPCWFDGSNSLDAPAVDPTTAPHYCMMPDCPGPVNKRKLEAFADLLAALQVLVLTPHIRNHLAANDPMALEQARAAIAKATGPVGPGAKL